MLSNYFSKKIPYKKLKNPKNTKFHNKTLNPPNKIIKFKKKTNIFITLIKKERKHEKKNQKIKN